MSTAAPQVMDALAILGLDNDDGRDDFLDGDEEILCENNTGNGEDRDFDMVIGVIEGIMVSEQFSLLLETAIAAAAMPDDLSEHERYIVYKRYLETIEEYVDVEVTAALPEAPLQRLAELVKSRESEVSDDVIDLVNGACISYQQFEALWRVAKKQPAADNKK